MASSQPSELLDVSHHSPEDWEGKVLEAGGAAYWVGQRLGSGADKIVHKLCNQRSGLSTLVVKFWRDFENNESATEYFLRSIKSAAGFKDMLGQATFHLHGGVFELQDFTGDYEPAGSLVGDLVDRADALMMAGLDATWEGVHMVSRPDDEEAGRMPSSQSLPVSESFVMIDPDGSLTGTRAANFQYAVRRPPARSKVGQIATRLSSEKGRLARAEGLYKRALELNPDHSVAWANLASLYARRYDYHAAAAAIAVALAIEPNELRPHKACVNYAFAAGRPRMAIMAYEHARERFGTVYDLNERAIECYLLCGEVDRAAELVPQGEAPEATGLREIVETADRRQTEARAVADDAYVYAEAGEWINARDLLRRAVQIFPNDVRILASLGMVERTADELEPALETLDGALARVRDGTDEAKYCHAAKGFTLLQTGRLEEGVDALSAAWESMCLQQGYPDDPDLRWLPGVPAWMGRGKVFELTGLARVLLDQALEAADDDPALRLRLETFVRVYSASDL